MLSSSYFLTNYILCGTEKSLKSFLLKLRIFVMLLATILTSSHIPELGKSLKAYFTNNCLVSFLYFSQTYNSVSSKMVRI